MRKPLTMGLLVAAVFLLPAGAGAQSNGTTVVGNDPSLSCPTTTLCYAVGSSGPVRSVQTGVVTILDGRQTHYQRVPNHSGSAFSLSGISCPTSGFCLAVGANLSALAGVLVEVRNGKVAKVSELAWTPSVVACPNMSRCVIAGQEAFVRGNTIVHDTIEAAVVSGTRIVASDKQPLSSSCPAHASGGHTCTPSAGVVGLSCASASACELAGSTQPGSHYFFEGIGAGAKLGPPYFTQLLDTDNDVGVACPPDQSTCYLSGVAPNHEPMGALYSTTIGGSALTPISTFNAELFHLSCSTLAQCTGAGDAVAFETGPAGPPPALVTFTNGQPGPVQEQFSGLRAPIDGGGFEDVVTTSDATWVAIAPSSTNGNTAFIQGTIP